MIVNAPPERQVPILVRGGETVQVRTERQQHRASSGAVIHIHMGNNPTPVEWVRKAVVEGLRQTGQTVDKFFLDSAAPDVALTS